MPLVKVTTNINPPDRKALLTRLSQAVAGLLDKPERFVMIEFIHNPDMLFAGSDHPLAYVEFKSIGLPEQSTRELSAQLTALLESEIGIMADRTYVEFANAARHLWGWNGGTFEK